MGRKILGIDWGRDVSVTAFLLLVLLLITLRWWDPQEGCYATGRFSANHMKSTETLFMCGERQMVRENWVRAEGWYLPAAERGHAPAYLRLYEIYTLQEQNDKAADVLVRLSGLEELAGMGQRLRFVDIERFDFGQIRILKIEENTL